MPGIPTSLEAGGMMRGMSEYQGVGMSGYAWSSISSLSSSSMGAGGLGLKIPRSWVSSM